MNEVLIAVGILVAVVACTAGIVWACFFTSSVNRSTSDVAGIVKQLIEIENRIRQVVNEVSNTSQLDELQQREIRQMLKITETRILDSVIRVSESLNQLIQIVYHLERKSGGSSVSLHNQNVTRVDDSCARTDFHGDTQGDVNINSGDGQMSAEDLNNNNRGMR